MEEELTYHKIYYIKNKSKILEKQKMRRLDPSFKIKMSTYYKNYYLKNKDRPLEPIICKKTTNRKKREIIPITFTRKTITLNFD